MARSVAVAMNVTMQVDVLLTEAIISPARHDVVEVRGCTKLRSATQMEAEIDRRLDHTPPISIRATVCEPVETKD